MGGGGGGGEASERVLSAELFNSQTHPTSSGILLPGWVWILLFTECFVRLCGWKTASGLRADCCQWVEHDLN